MVKKEKQKQLLKWNLSYKKKMAQAWFEPRATAREACALFTWVTEATLI